MDFEEADVVIAGGSLAGASAGIALSRGGKSVLILEKSDFPRQKVCGEFLSPGVWPVLERLGVDEKVLHAGGSRIQSALIRFNRREQIKLSLPAGKKGTGSGYGLSRTRLDDLLLREAQQRGCRVMQGMEVTEIRREKQGFCVSAKSSGKKREGETRKFSAPYLINACGSNQRWNGAAKALRRKTAVQGHVGFKAHFRGPERKAGVEIFFFPGGYMGLSAIENGLTNLCGLCDPSVLKSNGGSWDRLLADAGRGHPELEAWLGHAQRVGLWLACGPIHHGRQSKDFAWGFPAGDAGCFLEPFMGQGMTMALSSGLVLGAALNTRAPEAFYREHFSPLYRSRLWTGHLFTRAVPWLGGKDNPCRKWLQNPLLWKSFVRLACSSPPLRF